MIALLVLCFLKSNAADDAAPTIEMEHMPLSEAIRNIARQIELNYIIHPRLLDPSGSLLSDPPITVRWRNITAKEALKRLINEHGLAIVTNSVTTVARIVPADAVVKPISADTVGNDTSAVVRVLSIDDSLAEAIGKVAGQAKLRISFEPDTARVLKSGDAVQSPITIYYRWENITPRQALAALLDNYDLVAIEDAKNSSARIALKIATSDNIKRSK